jgi:hypothetical protein
VLRTSRTHSTGDTAQVLVLSSSLNTRKKKKDIFEKVEIDVALEICE